MFIDLSIERPGIRCTDDVATRQFAVMKALKARLNRCDSRNNNNTDSSTTKGNGNKASQDRLKQRLDMRYSNLIVQLEDLQNLNKIHSRHLDWLRSNLSLLRLPTLFSEIFDMPISSKSSTSSVISESSEDEALVVSINGRSDNDNDKITETIVANNNVVDSSPNVKGDLIHGSITTNTNIAQDTAAASCFELRDSGNGDKDEEMNIVPHRDAPNDRAPVADIEPARGNDFEQQHRSGNITTDTSEPKTQEPAGPESRQFYDCDWPNVVSQHHMSSEDLYFNDFGNLVDDSDDNMIDAANLNPTVHRLVADEHCGNNPNNPSDQRHSKEKSPN